MVIAMASKPIGNVGGGLNLFRTKSRSTPLGMVWSDEVSTVSGSDRVIVLAKSIVG